MQQSKNSQLGVGGLSVGVGGAAELEQVIKHLLGKSQTATLVRVVKINASGVSPVGTVDVKPLIHQLDGEGNIHELGIVFDVPYFRLQGGANAIICDPSVGDIGICLFASRDISTVKRTKKAAAPNSRRQYDWNDGLYIGGVLNGAPSQYVFFSSSGINVLSPTKITLTAPNVEINGNTQINGGSVKHNDKNIGHDHTHSGISPGNSNTGAPNP